MKRSSENNHSKREIKKKNLKALIVVNTLNTLFIYLYLFIYFFYQKTLIGQLM